MRRPLTQGGSGSGAESAPAYLTALFDIVAQIGEGTYGVVYLARSRAQFPRTLAVKTFKPGREGEGVSPTAIREMMLLRELRHDNIVRLDSVHLNRQVASGSAIHCMRMGALCMCSWHAADVAPATAQGSGMRSENSMHMEI